MPISEKSLANLKPRPRKKGTKNKFTNLKESFLEVYKNLGGAEGQLKWAKKEHNQGDFYKMVAKMLPATVGFDEEKPLMVKIEKADKEIEIKPNATPNVKIGKDGVLTITEVDK